MLTLPEILAPCGNEGALDAALSSKADAVYIGLEKFSARGSAENFSYDGLSKAVEKCRLFGVKIYLALNTLVFDGEMPLIRECVINSAKAGVDAIIVQDMGVVGVIKDIVPNMPLHASTQMSVTSSSGAEVLKKLGFSRVVLARELSLGEIAEINKNTGVETEVFVHGAYCVSVSGQCFMSSFFGNGKRSGNRGLCAQPCRLNFCGDGSEYALSLKDLSLVEHIGELREAGVTSFKIEGRMKRPEYVAAAVTACRNVLDGRVSDRISDMELLRKVFSRSGFSDGYFTGNYADMNGIRTKEDVVEGTRAVKVLKNTAFEMRGRYGLNLSLKVKPSEKISCRAFVNGLDCVEVLVYGVIPKMAVNHGITEKLAVNQLSKLGGTIFFAGEIKCDIEPGLSVSLSDINNLRRGVVEAISQKIIEKNSKIYSITPERNDCGL